MPATNHHNHLRLDTALTRRAGMRSEQIDQILDDLGRWVAGLDDAVTVADTPTRYERLVMTAAINGALHVDRDTRQCHAGLMTLPYDAVLACLGNGWLVPDDDTGYEVTVLGHAALHDTPAPSVRVAA